MCRILIVELTDAIFETIKPIGILLAIFMRLFMLSISFFHLRFYENLGNFLQLQLQCAKIAILLNLRFRN